MDEQAVVHDAIANALRELGYLDDGELLTGWVLAFETLPAEGKAACAHFYGPASFTSWRALGLTEWVARHTLIPGDEED